MFSWSYQDTLTLFSMLSSIRSDLDYLITQNRRIIYQMGKEAEAVAALTEAVSEVLVAVGDASAEIKDLVDALGKVEPGDPDAVTALADKLKVAAVGLEKVVADAKVAVAPPVPVVDPVPVDVPPAE
jgi:hypothetical protein